MIIFAALFFAMIVAASWMGGIRLMQFQSELKRQSQQKDFEQETQRHDVAEQQRRKEIEQLEHLYHIRQQLADEEEIRLEKCRETLERLFVDHKFPSSQPRWLVRKLNLVNNGDHHGDIGFDCYNDDLQIACDVISFDHYVADQMGRNILIDDVKATTCLDRGVSLIIVPLSVVTDDIPMFIEQKCHSLLQTTAV